MQTQKTNSNRCAGDFESDDSFVVDMEGLSNPTNNDMTTANSTSTVANKIKAVCISYKKMQRSLSRKGSQRNGEKKNISNNVDDTDFVLLPNSSCPSSPKELFGNSTPERPTATKIGASDSGGSTQTRHQITIMAGNITNADGKYSRRLSFRRQSSPSWGIDPRRILFFFATLSSMGTMLLIYFTLTMRKNSGDDSLSITKGT